MSFNRDFAAKTFDIISKLDDDEAVMFTRFVVYDVLMQDMQNNQRTISKAVDEILEEIREDVSKSLSSRPNDDRAIAAAALVGLVSKDKFATNWEEKYHRQQARDKSGRWSVSFSAQKEKGKKKGGNLQYGPANGANPQFDLTSAINGTGDATTAFADKWNGRGQDDEESSTSRMFNRIQAGSELLANTGRSTGNAKLALAGEAGKFFGTYGPQAEKVIGPPMRRAAYRYRGTEKRPDPALNESFTSEMRAIKRDAGLGKMDPPTETMRRTASEKAAIKYLQGRLPNKSISELQQKSGKIPPSEGVLINADGKIITQSIGYMDDHYLPFDLKNLKGMQGGTYVRTRSSGGPTTEDIYTGLVAGARSITVVSRSGIFTIDLEDDFRGQRRYNDKAAGMVNRYAQTLDAVKSKDVTRAKMPLEEQIQIRQEVEQEMAWADHGEVEVEVKRRIEEARSNPRLSKTELDEIGVKAFEAAEMGGPAPRGQFTEREWERVKTDPKKRLQAYRHSMIQDALNEKEARKFQLDGEGYAVAMEALREQYPYYIENVRAIHYRDPHGRDMSSETDAGYVAPRYIRPAEVKTGYYGKDLGGKKSAAETNYQNWSGRKGAAAAKTAVDTDAAAAAAPAQSAAQQALAQRQAVHTSKKKREANTMLESVMEDIAQAPISASDENHRRDYSMILAYKAADDPYDILNNDAKREQLQKDLDTLISVLGDPSQPDLYKNMAEKIRPKLKAVKATQVSVGGKPWKKENYKGGPSPDLPYHFEGTEYMDGQPVSVYLNGFNKLSGRVEGQLGFKIQPEWSQEKMRTISTGLGRMYKAFKEGPVTKGEVMLLLAQNVPDMDEDKIALFGQRLSTKQGQQQVVDKWPELIEALERARRIKVVAGDQLLTPTASSSLPSAPAPHTTGVTKDALLGKLAAGRDAQSDQILKSAFHSVHKGVATDDMDLIVSGLSGLNADDPILARNVIQDLKVHGVLERDFDIDDL